MKILWYSLGFFEPGYSSGLSLMSLSKYVDNGVLAELTGNDDWVFFFSASPVPDFEYDPVELALRIVEFGYRKPKSAAAFVTTGGAESVPTQHAFAFQVGRILGIPISIETVTVDVSPVPRKRSEKKTEDLATQADLRNPVVGPLGSDWPTVLSHAVKLVSSGSKPEKPVAGEAELFAMLYLERARRALRFSETERKIFEAAVVAEVKVTAAAMAAHLVLGPVTTKRAITAAAQRLDPESTTPAAITVGALAARYSWFIRYNFAARARL